MHPGIYRKWKKAREQGDEAHAGWCGGGGHGGRSKRGEGGYEASGNGHLFGVRRPLRFMAHKLELDDDQVKVLARILNDLKTERGQASVDDQRTVSAFADALAGEEFDEAKAAEGLRLRVDSAERLKNAVLGALRDTHKMLNADQRERLAYMLRSGTLTI